MRLTSLFFSFICLVLLFASKLPFAAEKSQMHLSFPEAVKYMNTLGYSMEQLQSFGYTIVIPKNRQIQLSFPEAVKYMNTLGYSMEQLQSFGYIIDIPESDWKQGSLKPYSVEMMKYLTCLLETGPQQNRVSWEEDVGTCHQKNFAANFDYDCQSFAAIKNANIAMESKTGACQHFHPKLVQSNCKRLIETVSRQNYYEFTNSNEESSFRSCCESTKINYSINQTAYSDLCGDTTSSTTHCNILEIEERAADYLQSLCFEEPRMIEAKSKSYCGHFSNTNLKLYNKYCEEPIGYSVCFYVPNRSNFSIDLPEVNPVLPDGIPLPDYSNSFESALNCLPLQLPPVFTIADLKKLEKEEHIFWEDGVITQKIAIKDNDFGYTSRDKLINDLIEKYTPKPTPTPLDVLDDDRYRPPLSLDDYYGEDKNPKWDIGGKLIQGM